MNMLRFLSLLAFAFVLVSGQSTTARVPHAPPQPNNDATVAVAEQGAPQSSGAQNADTMLPTTTKVVPDTTSQSPSMTTESSTTTETASTSSTEPSTSSTEASTSSTEASTSSVGSTSTAATDKTTAETPTPAPTSPAKPDAPHAGSWNITKDGHVCLKMNMAVQIEYNNTYQMVAVNVPTNATIDEDNSSCRNETDILTLTWTTYSVAFKFCKNTTKNEYKLENVTFTDGMIKPDHLKATEALAATVGSSYKCTSSSSVALTNGVLHLSDVQVQAFMEKDDFGKAQVCAADDTTSDIVPIAVGCALIALVIIVLIAYIVGRRISRQKGYQSV